MPLVERLPLSEAAREFAVWGTIARVVVTSPSDADDAEHLVRGYLDEVDAACSRFRPSELSAVRGSAAVSPLLADLVTAALVSADETGGDVDPTLGSDLVALGYDRDFAQVSGVRVSMRRRVRFDWRAITLADGVLTLPPGCALDLGASAKAFAADACARLVHETLGCDVLVSLGGDVALGGGSAWPVLVRDGDAEPSSAIELRGGGLATSSTISRAWGPGVHHILDPARGEPSVPVWRTVSVVAPSCRRANALSTAAVVRGLAAPAWLRSLGVPARLVAQDGSVVRLGGWP
jgi:FAD:protein FMN transferase